MTQPNWLSNPASGNPGLYSGGGSSQGGQIFDNNGNIISGTGGNNSPPPRPLPQPAPAAPQTSGAAPTAQTPGPFGTGTYIPPEFPINYGAITGNPNPGAGSNYGLNDVYSQLQNATNNLQPRNYSVTAPTGTAATGTAAQGTASTYAPAQGGAAGYNAALGGASSIGGVSGVAAQGNAAYADPTRISTAGDLAWQAQQQQLADILARQAAGGGMSPADIQLRRGTEDQIAGNLAVLGSQRGSGNFALAQRSAADQRAQAEEALNSQMGLQRAQETIQAQQALGGVLGTARGQAQNYNVNQADLLQQLRMGNAGFTQGMTLADLAAINSQTQQNVGLAQQSNEFNAGQSQNMTLADMQARDAALQYNASNSQQAMLANLMARNNALQYNAGSTQGMTLADLAARNQFGMANLENTQQTNLANTALAGQYGLANQSAALQGNSQYYNQLLALLGAQGAIGQSNRAAGLAGQQLGVQQNTALDQIAAEAYAASAQANANLTGGVIGGAGAFGASLINKFTGQPTTASDPNAVSYPTASGGTTTDPTNPAIYTDSPTGDPTTLSSPYGGPPIMFPQQSDENVKAGIEGGNPMLDSFLRQYDEARGKTPDIDPDSGLSFHAQRYSKALSGYSGGGGNSDAQVGADAASLVTGLIPFVGGAISKGIQGMAGGSGGSPVMSTSMSSPSTGLQQIGVSDQELQEVSDERDKTDIRNGDDALKGELGVLARPGGGISSEYSITVSDPRLNGGRPTNIPTLVKGQQDVYGILTGNDLTDEQQELAIQRAAERVANGATLPSFDTMQQADREAELRHERIAKFMDLVGSPAGTAPQVASTLAPGANIRNAGSLFPWPATPNLDASMSSMSDENEKEAVTSGNRGLQAFLEQQNAQTNAQNSQGSYNNAFMQNGAPLQPQVNTQLPPNPNASYGQPSLQDLLSYGYGGGGIAGAGGYSSGGFSPGGMIDMGSEYGAGIADPGSYQAGGVTGTAGPATAQPPIPMPNLATTPIGASAPWGGNPLLKRLPHAGPLVGNATPINSTTPSTNPASLGLTPGAPGWGGASFAPGSIPGLSMAGVAPAGPTTGFAPVSGFQAPRLSDETQKSSVYQDPSELRGFLDALHAHSYRYKDPDAPGAGHGRYVSPMAQELEKTDLGKSFVVKNSDGHLMVDYGKMAGTQLAATAMMNERVSKLEKLLGGPPHA